MAAQHGFGVTATRESYYQIAIRSPRKFEDISDFDIQGREDLSDLSDLTGEQVPETTSIEQGGINVKEHHHNCHINIVELLQ